MKIHIMATNSTTPITRSLPVSLDFPGRTPNDVTAADVKRKLAEKYPEFYAERQKLSAGDTGKGMDDNESVQSVGVADGGKLYVKDLGPQISWKTVFLVEYAGPLVIHPIFYFLGSVLYGQKFEHSSLQKYVFGMVMLHFMKRELETLFVHRFSHSTMPLRNIFKNSAHYHLLSGIALAYSIYRPKYSAAALAGTVKDNTAFLQICATVWAFAEISNLHAHIVVKNLRPAGSKVRGIPKGYMFEYISFPNYFFEILAWSSISVMTNDIAAHVFLVVSSLQMLQWALKKHRAYKKEFGKAYPRRKALIPFVI